MNAQAFDGLTRRLTTGVPRRQTIALLAGALSAMLAGDEHTVEAGCKKVNKKCDKKKDCCDDARCKGKKCKCKTGFDECTGKCFNLDSDASHCGACDNPCGVGESCVVGVCTIADGCPVGADGCTGAKIACGDVTRCQCSRSTAGETICGDIHTEGALCGQCDVDADCEAFGPDAFCVLAASGPCCGPDLQNVCRIPCGASES